jgi:hypothetical protein
MPSTRPEPNTSARKMLKLTQRVSSHEREQTSDRP